MRLIRWVATGLAVTLFGLGLISGLMDLSASVALQSWQATPLGLAWRTYHPSSLQQFEFGVQQYISADLWFDTVVPALLAPMTFYLLGLALVFFLIGRFKRSSPRHRAA